MRYLAEGAALMEFNRYTCDIQDVTDLMLRGMIYDRAIQKNVFANCWRMHRDGEFSNINITGHDFHSLSFNKRLLLGARYLVRLSADLQEYFGESEELDYVVWEKMRLLMLQTGLDISRKPYRNIISQAEQILQQDADIAESQWGAINMMNYYIYNADFETMAARGLKYWDRVSKIPQTTALKMHSAGLMKDNKLPYGELRKNPWQINLWLAAKYMYRLAYDIRNDTNAKESLLDCANNLIKDRACQVGLDANAPTEAKMIDSAYASIIYDLETALFAKYKQH